MRTILMVAAAAAMVSSVQAADIVRYPLGGGSTFPIARAVEIPAGFKLIFHSGFTPQPADPKAQENTPAYWGDTRTQAISALKRLEESLKSMGLGFGDVVKMNVFLVGEPGSGKMDFKGFMEAYTQFFGTREQPNLPARSAVQVAALAVPGMLVEIEVVLAKQAH
ncbi:MAG: RidA family protein [Sinobacteraceae bacterium]|nr:RidA family protein [Nevskiaceae bacterium]MBV9914601.1 RidA family protein [Nevskiaceae bacterium]